MRFHRTAKIFRGRFDAAPLAGIFFLLLIFLLLTSLVYTPGVPASISSRPVNPPALHSATGVTGATVVVTVNVAGNFFFENQLIGESELQSKLAAMSLRSRTPLTLIVLADKNVEYGVIVHLTQIAERSGITNVLLQGRPLSASPAS